jgi:hypothetical protein
MNKKEFKSLIEAIDNVVFAVARAGELKGIAWQRSKDSKDNIEKEAYMYFENNRGDDINKHRQGIRDMLTNFMDNTKDENDEQ